MNSDDVVSQLNTLSNRRQQLSRTLAQVEGQIAQIETQQVTLLQTMTEAEVTPDSLAAKIEELETQLSSDLIKADQILTAAEREINASGS